MRGKRIHLQTIQVVLNLHEYFTKEKEKGELLIPTSSVLEPSKRNPPAFLQNILYFDIRSTEKLKLWLHHLLPSSSLALYCKVLEISCHGIPWLAFWIAFTWLFGVPSLVPMQINMLFGLLLDIVFIALIKSFVRRRRPVANVDDKLGQIGPDKFSFPSGHASRAVFVTYFFLNLYTIPIIFSILILFWAILVCFSRILLNRHYLLDVLGGVCLGLIEGILLGILWLSDGTSQWLMGAISDENWSGGEYHV